MAKRINGILCNDAGQPITMNNGYSSEDVEELEKRNYHNDTTEDITDEDEEEIIDELEEQTEEDDGYEYIDGIRFKDGFLCNDAGDPINMENGYSSEDEEYSINFYKEHKYHNYQNEDDDFERE